MCVLEPGRDGSRANRLAASLAQLPASAELSRPSQWVQSQDYAKPMLLGGNTELSKEQPSLGRLPADPLHDTTFNRNHTDW